MPTTQANGRTKQHQTQASLVQEEGRGPEKEGKRGEWRNPRRTSGINDPQISIEDRYKTRRGRRDIGLRDEGLKSCWIVEGYSDNKGVRQSDKNIIAELQPENTSKPLIYSEFCLGLMQFSSQ